MRWVKQKTFWPTSSSMLSSFTYLQIMDYSSLPHFCRRENNGKSRVSSTGVDDCYSLDHTFHQQLCNYIKQQAKSRGHLLLPKQGSLHVDVPISDWGTKLVKQYSFKFQLHRIVDHNKLSFHINLSQRCHWLRKLIEAAMRLIIQAPNLPFFFNWMCVSATLIEIYSRPCNLLIQDFRKMWQLWPLYY